MELFYTPSADLSVSGQVKVFKKKKKNEVNARERYFQSQSSRGKLPFRFHSPNLTTNEIHETHKRLLYILSRVWPAQRSELSQSIISSAIFKIIHAPFHQFHRVAIAWCVCGFVVDRGLWDKYLFRFSFHGNLQIRGFVTEFLFVQPMGFTCV